MSGTGIQEPSSTSSIQNDAAEKIRNYEWNDYHWEKMLAGCNPDLVMRLRPQDPTFLYDPLTWKFRTDPDHAWSIPTGNRTPNREALKVLRRKMEERGEIPLTRRHHHHHHHHQHHHSKASESEVARMERKAKKGNKRMAKIASTASPVHMAIQIRQSHVNWSVTQDMPKTASRMEQEGKKEKKRSKKSGKSHEAVLSETSSTDGPPAPPPLQVIEVTFFSVALHWYDLTDLSENVDELPELAEEQEEEDGEEKEEGGISAVDIDAEISSDEGVGLSEKEDLKTVKTKTLTLKEAGHRASLEAQLLGDSRLVYILESKEVNNDFVKDWKAINVSYGCIYVHDNLRARTSYMYRVRSMDHERGIVSPWTEVLQVTTKRPPYSLQDVLLRISSNDIAGIVEILETGEVNVNAEDAMGFTPLMRAAQQEKTKLMQALIRNGADPNFQSKDQRRTALMVAAYSGNLQAVKTLRLFDASYDLFDSSHLSAVHWTVDSGNMDLMEYILADGANIECVDNKGWTPLHRTALVGNKTEGVCEVLIRYGAKIDKLDKDLKTPLMNATISNKGQIAQILILRGADVFIANKEGRTAYDLACALERKGTMMLLEDLAKKQNKEISMLHGQGLKGGPAKIEQDELENLDSFARRLAQKMRKKPSIDPQHDRK